LRIHDDGADYKEDGEGKLKSYQRLSETTSFEVSDPPFRTRAGQKPAQEERRIAPASREVDQSDAGNQEPKIVKFPGSRLIWACVDELNQGRMR